MSKVFEDRDFVKEFINLIIDLYENRPWNNNKQSDCEKVETYVNYLLTLDDKKKVTEYIINYTGFPASLFFLVISWHLKFGLCLHGLFRTCDICHTDYNNYINSETNPIYI